jgi:hypothetical protein
MPGQLVRQQAPQSELRQAPQLEGPLGRQTLQLQQVLLVLQLLVLLVPQLLEQLAPLLVLQEPSFRCHLR